MNLDVVLSFIFGTAVGYDITSYKIFLTLLHIDVLSPHCSAIDVTIFRVYQLRYKVFPSVCVSSFTA